MACHGSLPLPEKTQKLPVRTGELDGRCAVDGCVPGRGFWTASKLENVQYCNAFKTSPRNWANYIALIAATDMISREPSAGLAGVRLAKAL